MLDHHIQKSIVYRLAFRESARFSELQPDGVENKLFTYHLKKVVASGLAIKSEDGLYTLTPEGRRVSTGIFEKDQKLIVDRAHSVLFLVIRQNNNWLLYKRGTYPMLGFSGFMHCNPTSQTDCEAQASKECAAKTGLTGTFTALGGGYFRIYENDSLESFTHFTLLYCDDIQGELQPTDTQAEYFWVPEIEISNEMFPGTALLKEAYEAKQPFFIDKTFSL